MTWLGFECGGYVSIREEIGKRDLLLSASINFIQLSSHPLKTTLQPLPHMTCFDTDNLSLSHQPLEVLHFPDLI